VTSVAKPCSRGPCSSRKAAASGVVLLRRADWRWPSALRHDRCTRTPSIPWGQP
jgi:hypothetical protein